MIAGQVDPAELDRQLRAIRSAGNMAIEATTIEDARRHVETIQHQIAALRGNFGQK